MREDVIEGGWRREEGVRAPHQLLTTTCFVAAVWSVDPIEINPSNARSSIRLDLSPLTSKHTPLSRLFCCVGCGHPLLVKKKNPFPSLPLLLFFLKHRSEPECIRAGRRLHEIAHETLRHVVVRVCAPSFTWFTRKKKKKKKQIFRGWPACRGPPRCEGMNESERLGRK